MVNNNQKENKNNEEGTRADGGIKSQVRMIHPTIKDPIYRADWYTGHEVDETGEIDNAFSLDLGDQYLHRMQEAMEEWYSKPREGQHLTDVVMCPRQRVYREIDRLPIDAKTVSIYSAGKAIHEAVQWLLKGQ